MNISKPLILIAAILLFSYSIFAQEATSSESLPKYILNKNIQALDGKPFLLAETKGKVTIIILWASWCGPCRVAADGLNKVRGDYVARNVEIVGLTYENPRRDRSSVRKFVRANQIRFKIGWIDAQTAIVIAGNHAVLPQILVITNDGHVLKRFLGYNPNQEATLTKLNEIVTENLTR